MDKLLILGIETLAGSNLALAFKDRCEILGVSFDGTSRTEYCRALDARSISELRDVIATEQPQWTIYCGPASRSAWDWKDDFDFGQEVKRVAVVAEAVRSFADRLTLISTDAVFCGPHIFCRESFAPCDRPLSVAIRRIEQAGVSADALVVRTHLFGWSPDGNTCVEHSYDALAAGLPMTADGSRYASPIFVTDFAELLWIANRKRLSGIRHLAGAERVSMWQFARLLTGLYELVPSQCQAPALQPPSLVADPHETSLDSRATQRLLGTSLPLLRDGITRFIAEISNGYRDRLQARPARSASAAAA